MKKRLIAALVISLIAMTPAMASATDVIFGLSYRLAKPADEIADVGSDFKANLGLKLDISKIFETHMSL
ncbi:MAG TPA: hypothetical protein PLI10_02130, partial [Bacillota bacterium]|nr:hypothetical protein [Bacillota bacterium]